MKIYTGYKKHSTKIEYCANVYNDDGEFLDSILMVDYDLDKVGRYDIDMQLLSSIVPKIRWYCDMKKYSFVEGEDLKLFISNKTIYSWFEKDIAPNEYIDAFYTLQSELSHIPVDVEIILLQKQKIVFKESIHVEKYESLGFLASIGE